MPTTLKKIHKIIIEFKYKNLLLILGSMFLLFIFSYISIYIEIETVIRSFFYTDISLSLNPLKSTLAKDPCFIDYEWLILEASLYLEVDEIFIPT